MRLLIMLLAAGVYACGGMCMKLSAGLSNIKWVLLMFLCFCIGAAIQAWSMKGEEMAVNYVIVLGFEGLLMALAGHYFFDEPLSIVKSLGMILILAGTAVLRAG